MIELTENQIKQTTATPSAILFDLDGTLIDTEKIYRKLWPKAISDMGYTLTDDMYLKLRSLGRPFAPALFKEWYGPDFDYNKARKIRSAYFKEYIEANGIDVKSGAKALLTALKARNIKAYIVTATDIERAGKYLKMTGLDGFFDRIVSATEVSEGKPSPYVYEYALRELNLDPSKCLAVEDAPNGIISAYRAGLRVIMVPDLTEPDEELSKMLYAKFESLDKILELNELK